MEQESNQEVDNPLEPDKLSTCRMTDHLRLLSLNTACRVEKELNLHLTPRNWLISERLRLGNIKLPKRYRSRIKVLSRFLSYSEKIKSEFFIGHSFIQGPCWENNWWERV